FGIFDWYDHVLLPVEKNSFWNLWIYDMRLERCIIARANTTFTNNTNSSNGKSSSLSRTNSIPKRMIFKFAFESLKEKLGLSGKKSFYLSDSTEEESSSHASLMTIIRRI